MKERNNPFFLSPFQVAPSPLGTKIKRPKITEAINLLPCFPFSYIDLKAKDSLYMNVKKRFLGSSRDEKMNF